MADGQLRYFLKFRSPVGVFTGLGIAGLVDRIVVRDTEGLPYIPGSTIKGRLRFFAERVLRIRTTSESALWSHAAGQPHCKHLEEACTLCCLFGNPAIAGLLSVGQATLESPWDKEFRQLLEEKPNPVLRAGSEIRPGVGLSRLRRTSLSDHLFFDETVPAVSFSGKLLLDSQIQVEQRRFLIGVGRLVDALGNRKAAGRGRLEDGIRIEEKAS